jgi:hypothetical protein
MRTLAGFAAPGLFAIAAPAWAEDSVHDVIQKLFDAIQSDADFAKSGYPEMVSEQTAAQLKSMRACELGSVSRTQGDAMALVHWSCPSGGAMKPVTAMLMFENARITSIQFVSFVQVDTAK